VVARKDPKALYELAPGIPGLAGVVLLHQLEGFMDAGGAGRLASEHLLDQFDHRLVASFDVDRLIDYRSRRPAMTFDKDHYDHYEQPALDVHLLTDSEGKRFLLLDGLEPDREWELFAAAVRSLIDHFDVRLTVGMHGIPMGIPHTRPLGITAHASNPALIDTADQPVIDRLQVPSSAASLLEYRLGEWGYDAAGSRCMCRITWLRRCIRRLRSGCCARWRRLRGWCCRIGNCGRRRGGLRRTSTGRCRSLLRSRMWCGRWSGSTTLSM